MSKNNKKKYSNSKVTIVSVFFCSNKSVHEIECI